MGFFFVVVVVLFCFVFSWRKYRNFTTVKDTGKKKQCVLSRFSHVRLFATLWTVAHQASPSLGFSRQEYWNRLSCPPPGDLPDPRMEPAFSHVSCIDKPIVYHTCEALHVALNHQQFECPKQSSSWISCSILTATWFILILTPYVPENK